MTNPDTGPNKTYHVHIGRVPDAPLLAALCRGIDDGGDRISAVSATLLRTGGKNAWVEIVLDKMIKSDIEPTYSGFRQLVRAAVER